MSECVADNPRLGITHLRDRSGKDNHFVQLTHPFHELVDSRSFYNVDVVILPFNFHGNGEVRTFENLNIVSVWHWVNNLGRADLETTVNQRLVQIKNQAFPVPKMGKRWWQEELLLRLL